MNLFNRAAGLRGRIASLAAGGAAALFALGIAQADVTVEQRIAVTGPMTMINLSGTSTTTISGDRSRSANDLQFESGILRALAGGAGQHVDIVNLGTDKIYALDPKKKTYTETTFSERRAHLQQVMDDAQKRQEPQQKAATGVDESLCEWSAPKSDVKKAGDKTSIAGYETEHVTIVASQSCTDRKTGNVCEFSLTVDEWLAPNFQDSAEALAYQKAYAEKLGLTASSSHEFSERAQSMFSQYKGIWGDIAGKMKDVKGYPVKSAFSLAVGGPQCKSASQQSQSAANGQPAGSGKPAGSGQAAGSGASAATPTSLSGALTGALGGLGGLLGKKKDAAPPPTPSGSTPPANGLVPLMTISSELVSVRYEAVGPQTFEVPPEYKKVAAR